MLGNSGEWWAFGHETQSDRDRATAQLTLQTSARRGPPAPPRSALLISLVSVQDAEVHRC